MVVVGSRVVGAAGTREAWEAGVIRAAGIDVPRTMLIRAKGGGCDDVRGHS